MTSVLPRTITPITDENTLNYSNKNLGYMLYTEKDFATLPNYAVKCPYCNCIHNIDYHAEVLYSDTISYVVNVNCPDCNKQFLAQLFVYRSTISFCNIYTYINPFKLVKGFAGCNLLVDSENSNLYSCNYAITNNPINRVIVMSLKGVYESVFDSIRGNIILQLAYSILEKKPDYLRKNYRKQMQEKIKLWLSNLTNIVNDLSYAQGTAYKHYTQLIMNNLIEVAYSYDNNIFDKYEYTLFKLISSMCNTDGMDNTGACYYTPVTKLHFALFSPYLNTERNN